MRKVHRSHVFIINIFDRKVSKKTSISQCMSSQINLFSDVTIVNIIFSPLFLQFLWFESYWKRPRKLYSFADRQIWSGFMIKKPQYSVIKINSCASKLNFIEIIKLFQSNWLNFLKIFFSLKLFLNLNIQKTSINSPWF